MKRYLLLLSLVIGMLTGLRAQYQFDHVKIIEAQGQADLIVEHQAIDLSTNERIIAGGLDGGSYNFNTDPASRAVTLTGTLENKEEYVAKYDQNGDLVWAYLITADQPTISISDMIVTDAGDIYIALLSMYVSNNIYFDHTSSTPTNSATDNNKFLIAKYNKDFDFIWSKEFFGTGANVADNFKLVATSSGVAAAMSVVGAFDLNPDPLVSNSLFSSGERSIALCHLDHNGLYVGGGGLHGSVSTSNPAVYDFVTDGTYFFLSGNPGISSSATLDLDTGSPTDFLTGENGFIAKYDGSFDFQTKLVVDNKRVSRLMELKVVSSTEIYAVGSFVGSKDFGSATSPLELQSNGGFTDLFVVKYDGDLNPLWGRSWGDDINDAYRGSTLIGNSIVLQVKSFTDVTYDQNQEFVHIAQGSYLLSLTSDGDVNWYKDYGNTDWVPLCLDADADDKLYPIGRLRSATMDFDPNDFFSESLTVSAHRFDLTMSKFTACLPFSKTTNLALACPGDSVVVDGTTYTEDKSIYRFASATNRCDSLIVTNVQFHPGGPLNLSPMVTNPSNCGLTDGSLVANITGGTAPYTYTLDGGTPQASATFAGLGYGIYEIEVADANGCSVVMTEILKGPVEQHGFEVDAINPLQINNVSCNGFANGQIEVNFINIFAPPIFYSLDGSPYQEYLGGVSSLSAGTHILDLRDIFGCTQPLAFEITEPEALAFSITNVTDASCPSSSDAEITLSASGGTSGYQYSLDNMTFTAFTSGSTTNIPNVSAGNVTVYIKDANGCAQSTPITVASTTDTVDPVFLTASSFSVDENTTGIIHTMQVSDNCTVIYTITSGPDMSAFSLDANTGELSFVVPPDFENPTDANQDNRYEVTITATDESGNTASLNHLFTVTNVAEGVTWTGNVDTDWGNSINWAEGRVPLSSDFVIIPAGTSFQPELTGDYIIQNLIVNNGAELIIHAQASLVIEGIFTGPGTVEVVKNATGEGGYSIMGSPFTSANLADLNADFLYDYDGTNFTVAVGAMSPGKGYFVGYSASSPVIRVSGTPNTGQVSINVSTSGDAFNLLANPYLAAIDRSAFVSANSSAIDGNIWLWNDGGANAGANRGGDYILINNMGVASTLDLGDGIAGNKTLPTTNTPITSFQGFLVNATSNTSIAFEPTMQTSAAGSNADGNFYRKADEEYAIIKLSLSNDENYNETLVGLVEGATIDHDYALDGAYRSVNPDFSFYTKMGDHKMAIQALPDHLEILEVPLGIEVRSTDTYELAVESLTNIEATRVSLQNELTGEVTKLSDGVALKLTAGLHEEYSLVFQPSEVLSISPISALRVSGTPKRLALETQLSGIHQTAIFDLSGKKYFDDVVNFEAGKAEIATSLSSQTVYLLKVNSQSVKFILQ